VTDFLDDLGVELRAAAWRQANGVRRRTPLLRRGVVSLAVTLAALVVVAVGVRAISDVTRNSEVHAPGSGSADGERSVVPALVNAFAVLRRPPGVSDAIPARWEPQLRLLAGENGAPAPSQVPDFSAARRVAPDVSAWVVPARGGVCLFEALGGGTAFGCTGTADVLEGRAFGIRRGAGYGLGANEVRVAGLLPDGATDVSLRLRDGTAEPVTVHSNFYAVDAAAKPTELLWTDAEGVRRSVSL
jgi:hypothetical protein